MKIKDFIESRNVSYDTVRKYIVSHSEMFEGHIGKPNNIILDETAIEILEKKYPVPEPVQVIQDKESREKLQEVTEKYTIALEKILRLTEENAKLLVTQAKQQVLEAEIQDKDKEILKLKSELELEKSKTWWDKLRGR